MHPVFSVFKHLYIEHLIFETLNNTSIFAGERPLGKSRFVDDIDLRAGIELEPHDLTTQ